LAPEVSWPAYLGVLTGLLLAWWLVFFTAAVVLALALRQCAALLAAYNKANKQKRPRYLIPPLLALGRLSHWLGARGPLAAVLQEAAEFHYGWGEWPDVLRLTTRMLGAGDSPGYRIQAAERTLEAMAVMGEREAFAVIYAHHEQRLESMLPEESLTPEREAQDPEAAKQRAMKSRLRYTPMYWRGVLAWRDADFADASHWFQACEKTDPDRADHLLALAEMAAQAGEDERALEYLKAARHRAEHESGWAASVRAKALEMVASPLGGEPSESRSTVERMFELIRLDDRWRVVWTEIKMAFHMHEPQRIQHVMRESAAWRPTHPTAQVQALVGDMLAACLLREGHAAEAPYAKALGLLKWERINPHTRDEIPLLRALGQAHRAMPEAALDKMTEIRRGPAWRVTKLADALMEAYTAWCLERQGRPKEGRPHHEKALSLLAKSTKLRALKLAKKAAA